MYRLEIVRNPISQSINEKLIVHDEALNQHFLRILFRVRVDEAILVFQLVPMVNTYLLYTTGRFQKKKKKEKKNEIQRKRGSGVPVEGEVRTLLAKAGGPVAVRTQPEARKVAWTANATLSYLLRNEGLADLITAITDLSFAISFLLPRSNSVSRRLMGF